MAAMVGTVDYAVDIKHAQDSLQGDIESANIARKRHSMAHSSARHRLYQRLQHLKREKELVDELKLEPQKIDDPQKPLRRKKSRKERKRDAKFVKDMRRALKNNGRTKIESSAIKEGIDGKVSVLLSARKLKNIVMSVTGWQMQAWKVNALIEFINKEAVELRDGTETVQWGDFAKFCGWELLPLPQRLPATAAWEDDDNDFAPEWLVEEVEGQVAQREQIRADLIDELRQRRTARFLHRGGTKLLHGARRDALTKEAKRIRRNDAHEKWKEMAESKPGRAPKGTGAASAPPE